MAQELNRVGVASAYDRWAPIYDLVFGPVFRRGRRAAIDAAETVGGRILEVGVGTGISLPHYRAESRITGIDIADQMLDKARDRVKRLRLDHVERIAIGDAEALDFDDASFDVVVAQYVVSAVPHPDRALSEFLRVVRPGGMIVIATRLGAEAGMRAKIERALMPITSRLGWRTDFPWSIYGDWAARNPQAELVERRPLPPLGHFSLVCFRRAGVPGQDNHPTPALGATA
ncbi:methyltransferase domain-containing protein [uncultured Sphingomonas sp.]|uniref:class I SAM-dependent methyltransferase n=1 Tax=uncultured Sphingomonas sp. TaxID=158754 RepID=UPI002582E808|nr:methyltransferase domain-containing protein [uncultured Sphingomonas sp.]